MIASPRHGRGVTQFLLEQFLLDSVRISTSQRQVDDTELLHNWGRRCTEVRDETRRIEQDNGICLVTLSAAAFKT